MYQVDQSAYWQAQLMNWGPKVLIAILILVATWAVARAVQWVLQKAIDRSPSLRKHVTGTPHETVGHQLGTIAKLIIWLVGIMAALQFLGIGQILAPINELVTEIFAFLPKLIGAGLIFFIGLIVARIVKRLVETALTAANIDGLLAKIGIGSTEGTVRTDPNAVPPGTAPAATRASLARAAGVLVFALIIIPVAIAALQVLGIEVHLGPRDQHAQRYPRGNPEGRRRSSLARHRVHRRPVPQDDHRGGLAGNWLRRCNPIDRCHSGEHQPVAHHCEHRDDRHHPRRLH